MSPWANKVASLESANGRIVDQSVSDSLAHDFHWGYILLSAIVSRLIFLLPFKNCRYLLAFFLGTQNRVWRAPEVLQALQWSSVERERPACSAAVSGRKPRGAFRVRGKIIIGFLGKINLGDHMHMERPEHLIGINFQQSRCADSRRTKRQKFLLLDILMEPKIDQFYYLTKTVLAGRVSRHAIFVFDTFLRLRAPNDWGLRAPCDKYCGLWWQTE